MTGTTLQDWGDQLPTATTVVPLSLSLPQPLPLHVLTDQQGNQLTRITLQHYQLKHRVETTQAHQLLTHLEQQQPQLLTHLEQTTTYQTAQAFLRCYYCKDKGLLESNTIKQIQVHKPTLKELQKLWHKHHHCSQQASFSVISIFNLALATLQQASQQVCSCEFTPFAYPFTCQKVVKFTTTRLHDRKQKMVDEYRYNLLYYASYFF